MTFHVPKLAERTSTLRDVQILASRGKNVEYGKGFGRPATS